MEISHRNKISAKLKASKRLSEVFFNHYFCWHSTVSPSASLFLNLSTPDVLLCSLLCIHFLYFINCVSSFVVIWIRNKKHRPKATANPSTSLFLNPVCREGAAPAVLSCLMLVSSGRLTGLSGETGAGGFSRGRPSRLCSSSALTRKARALRGKTAGAKRLQSGTKKWGR